MVRAGLESGISHAEGSTRHRPARLDFSSISPHQAEATQAPLVPAKHILQAYASRSLLPLREHPPLGSHPAQSTDSQRSCPPMLPPHGAALPLPGGRGGKKRENRLTMPSPGTATARARGPSLPPATSPAVALATGQKPLTPAEAARRAEAGAEPPAQAGTPLAAAPWPRPAGPARRRPRPFPSAAAAAAAGGG